MKKSKTININPGAIKKAPNHPVRSLYIHDELAAHCGGISAVGELLIRRGVTTPKESDAFFSPAISDLHDPFLMKDMDKAVNRLNKAMGSKEKIMIYGDYDVDGTTAVALVYKYLQNYYSNVEYYIPTRYEEGYGISMKSIDYAAGCPLLPNLVMARPRAV